MSSNLWMGIVPGPEHTRVLVLNGPGKTLLKARLPAEPAHPRAVETLCEAVALWCNQKVHAALAADNPDPTSATRNWLASFDTISRGPLYELRFVAHARRPRERDRLDGLGDFRDVRQLLLFGEAR